MKLSIASKNPNEAHVKQLLAAAHKRAVSAEVIDFKSANELKKQASSLGDVLIWRASHLDIRSERSSLGVFLKDTYVINDAIFRTPYVAFKYYQQTTVANLTRVNTIPTYRFRELSQVDVAVKNGVLRFPFIAKPNLGAKGFNVFLIESAADLQQVKDTELFVFQNFIPNKGDWRVIVLGGRALGAMRRQAKGNSHLNNIAKGATASVETRKKVLSDITEIATKAAAALGLVFCGVDIIQNETTKEYYFLETNSALEWQEFQAVTGVNVSEQVIDYCLDITARRSVPADKLVHAYYQKSIRDSGAKDFHYASRLYLWSHEPWARTVLDDIEGDYLGRTKDDTRDKLQSYLSLEVDSFTRIEKRRAYYKKYEQVHRYNHILFKVLFAETIYGRDLRPMVKDMEIDEAMVALYAVLKKDEEAIRILSTRAVNYFYLLSYYFGDERQLDLNPQWLIDLAKGYSKSGLEPAHEHKLKIYLLTHAIIGASQFYNRTVTEPVYRQMVIELERLIQENYFIIPLDAKCEFLVCAALTGYNSSLKPIIHSEAAQSLSARGNFIVDTYNNSIGKKVPEQLWQAEHRNVLYLMSTRPYIQADKTVRPLDEQLATLPVMGRKTTIDFPGLKLFGVQAKLDTGAFWSAIHCTNIKQVGDKLSFSLLDPAHAQYDRKTITITDFKKTPVKNTSGLYEDRYMVALDIVVRGVTYRERFTLADRSHMMFPVLLGRTFLKNRFVVNVSHLTIDSADRQRLKETSL